MIEFSKATVEIGGYPFGKVEKIEITQPNKPFFTSDKKISFEITDEQTISFDLIPIEEPEEYNYLYLKNRNTGKELYCVEKKKK